MWTKWLNDDISLVKSNDPKRKKKSSLISKCAVVHKVKDYKGKCEGWTQNLRSTAWVCDYKDFSCWKFSI